MSKAEMHKISWENSSWIFDIDDTLSDTSDVSSRATEGIKKVFSVKFGEATGEQIKQKVNELYSLMLAGYRVTHEDQWHKVPGGKHAFEKLLHTVSSLQEQVVSDYGMPKKWSRELFVKLAADALSLTVSPEMVSEAVDAYWIELSNITRVFPDALDLMKELRSHNKPIYLMTSSDARLMMKEDGQFIYDPIYSEGLKRERIELLRDKGVDFSVLSIGDPEDKPNLDFFEKGIRKIETEIGKKVDVTNAIMVGNSFSGDLKTPKEKMEFGMVVLIDRTHPHLTIVDEHQINTNDLSHITKCIMQSIP